MSSIIMSIGRGSQYQELKKYSEQNFPGGSNKFEYCNAGEYGATHPVLIVKTPSSQIHLIYRTSVSISHYTLSDRHEDESALKNLKREICDGPEKLIPLHWCNDRSKIVDNKKYKIGSFLYLDNSLILVSSAKFLLIKDQFKEMDKNLLLKVVNGISTYKFKEVNIKDYYGAEVMELKFPFLLKKMKDVLDFASKYIDEKFRKLENFISNKEGKQDQHQHRYYYGPGKVKRFIVSIVKKSHYLFWDRYLVYFTFKSLGNYHYFKVSKEKTLQDAENKCKQIENDLKSNKFQDDHRSELEVFKEYKINDFKSFKFRTGDCLIRSKYGYYHHGIFIGSAENFPSSKEKLDSKSIFHVSASGRFYKVSCSPGKNTDYDCISFNEFSKGYKIIKIKRNEFNFLTNKQYRKKANEIVLAFYIQKCYKKVNPEHLKDYNEFVRYYDNEKKPLVPFTIENCHDEVIIDYDNATYNLVTNNCGHIVNRFENKKGDVGPDNKKIYYAIGILIGCAVACVSYIYLLPYISEIFYSIISKIPECL